MFSLDLEMEEKRPKTHKDPLEKGVEKQDRTAEQKTVLELR